MYFNIYLIYKIPTLSSKKYKFYCTVLWDLEMLPFPVKFSPKTSYYRLVVNLSEF